MNKKVLGIKIGKEDGETDFPFGHLTPILDRNQALKECLTRLMLSMEKEKNTGGVSRNYTINR